MIRVNDNYAIRVDDRQFIAMEDKHKTDKSGCPVFETIGYYGKLGDAIKGIARKEYGKEFQAKDYSLNDAIRKIEEVDKKFTDLLADKLSEIGVVNER